MIRSRVIRSWYREYGLQQTTQGFFCGHPCIAMNSEGSMEATVTGEEVRAAGSGRRAGGSDRVSEA